MNTCLQDCTVTSDWALSFGSLRKREAVFPGRDPECSCKSPCLSLIRHMHVAACLSMLMRILREGRHAAGPCFCPSIGPVRRGRVPHPAAKVLCPRGQLRKLFMILVPRVYSTTSKYSLWREKQRVPPWKENHSPPPQRHPLISAGRREQLLGWCFACLPSACYVSCNVSLLLSLTTTHICS